MTNADTRHVAQWLLAIDSSSEQASLALFAGERIAETIWIAGRDQTATLLGEIDRLCSLVNIAITDVGAVAIATGPGMFNGLRVGMSVAKGLVLGLDLPLIGVSTLDFAAQPFRGLGVPVIAVVAAGRGRLVWAAYDGEGGQQRQTAPPCNGTVEELRSQVQSLPRVIVTGELTADQQTTLAQVSGVIIPPRSARLRRAIALADIAWSRWLADDVDDAVTLEPTYVHAASRTT